MAKVSELLKLLKKDGWFLFRNGSNHDIYRHPTKENQLTVPRHGSKEMAKGTYESILKAAGLK
jgi:mRNA interferase HicA